MIDPEPRSSDGLQTPRPLRLLAAVVLGLTLLPAAVALLGPESPTSSRGSIQDPIGDPTPSQASEARSEKRSPALDILAARAFPVGKHDLQIEVDFAETHGSPEEEPRQQIRIELQIENPRGPESRLQRATILLERRGSQCEAGIHAPALSKLRIRSFFFPAHGGASVRLGPLTETSLGRIRWHISAQTTVSSTLWVDGTSTGLGVTGRPSIREVELSPARIRTPGREDFDLSQAVSVRCFDRQSHRVEPTRPPELSIDLRLSEDQDPGLREVEAKLSLPRPGTRLVFGRADGVLSRTYSLLLVGTARIAVEGLEIHLKIPPATSPGIPTESEGSAPLSSFADLGVPGLAQMLLHLAFQRASLHSGGDPLLLLHGTEGSPSPLPGIRRTDLSPLSESPSSPDLAPLLETLFSLLLEVDPELSGLLRSQPRIRDFLGNLLANDAARRILDHRDLLRLDPRLESALQNWRADRDQRRASTLASFEKDLEENDDPNPPALDSPSERIPILEAVLDELGLADPNLLPRIFQGIRWVLPVLPPEAGSSKRGWLAGVLQWSLQERRDELPPKLRRLTSAVTPRGGHHYARILRRREREEKENTKR